MENNLKALLITSFQLKKLKNYKGLRKKRVGSLPDNRHPATRFHNQKQNLYLLQTKH